MAAPAFDASSKGTAVNASTISWSHTTGSGANRVLVVGVLINSSSVTCSGVTWNTSSNLTQVATAINGSARVYLWYLVNPAASTTATIKVTLSGAAGVVAGACSYTNASQATNPFGTSANATGTGTAVSVTVNSTDATMMICNVSGDQGAGTYSANSVTSRWTDASFANGGQGDKAGVSTSTTVSWTLSGSDSWVSLAAPLNVAGTQVFKDIIVRGRVSALVYKDITTRARISAIGYHDINFRGNVGNTVRKDITFRGRLAAQVFKDVTFRGRLGAQTFKDVAFRGNVGNTVRKDITFRGRLAAQVFKDVTLRGRLGAKTFKDVAFRGNVGSVAYKSISVRGRLSAQILKDITLRGRLGAKTYKDITLRGNIITRNVVGGATLWANGTGTASFRNFRWTQYPDPALSLAPVLPQANTSEVLWNETVPGNTSRTMYTSLDGVSFSNVTGSNGGSIPGITSQGAIIQDLWTSNTSANYTSTNKTGGSTATWAYSTPNSRITASGGSGALYLYTSFSSNHVDILCDMDESDAGGLCWCVVDAGNFYDLGVYDDSSSGGFTNQLRLYKVASNVRSLLTSSAITFNRSTTGVSPYHRIRATMASGLISVYFDSSTPLFTYTDSSPLAAGQAGLRNDSGTSRYYQLRLQALGDYVSGTPAGDIVSGKFVYTKQALSTTDPTQTPQILDLTTSVRSPAVDSGVLIPQLHDPSKPFANMYNTEFNTLAQSSGDYHWSVDTNGFASFNLRGVKIAPWCLHSADLLFAPTVTPASSADLYCNRIKITNVLFPTATKTEQKIADGSTTSWQMAYPLYSAPTITINSLVQTVGVQGIDTGKAFYWQPGSTSIGQDSNATKLLSGTIITFSYVGQTTGTVTRDNAPEQAARAAVEGNSGIVEVIVDSTTVYSSNIQMTQAQAQAYGDGYLARFGNNNAVTLTATTSNDRLGTRPAPQKGQLLPVFIPEHGLNNRQLLITKVTITAAQKTDTSLLYYYAIEATDGASLTNWISALKGL